MLTPRVDIPFWTLLISSKHNDIQQWWMIFLITVSLSAERSRKGVVTPIVYIFQGIHSEHFEMYLHQHNLTVLVIWFEYQNLEYLLCFYHQLAGPKRYTLTIIACFWDQGNHILMLEQLIDQNTQSHHCLIFDVM